MFEIIVYLLTGIFNVIANKLKMHKEIWLGRRGCRQALLQDGVCGFGFVRLANVLGCEALAVELVGLPVVLERLK